MSKPINNKVTIKLYGDQKMSQDLVDTLIKAGYKPYGSVAKGNPYTTQKGDSGWASNLTFFRPSNTDQPKCSEENTSRMVNAVQTARQEDTVDRTD